MSGERPNHTRPAVVREKLIAEMYMIKYIFERIKSTSLYSNSMRAAKIKDYMFFTLFPRLYEMVL